MATAADSITIPARRGTAALARRGQTITVVNTHGRQVVDTWAFRADDPDEFMSMEHSRPAMGRLVPSIGDALVTNRRRPILTLVADTTPGLHDTLVAACDRYRYEQLGAGPGHANCTDNLVAAMRQLGRETARVPCPLNLFMWVEVVDGTRLEFRASRADRGQYVALRAEMDLVVAFSACPQDLIPIGGTGHVPNEAHFTIV